MGCLVPHVSLSVCLTPLLQSGSLYYRLKRAQAKAAYEYRRHDDTSLDVSELGEGLGWGWRWGRG